MSTDKIRALEFQRIEAKSGKGTSVVVFLHGYGANGADLLGLADPLAPHLPDTVFIAPDAPEKCPAAGPAGYQWFPIPWIDGSSEQAAKDGMRRASDDLNAFLDKVLKDEGLTADRMVLFGFSQGTMMALHVAPRRPEPVACIVGFSGRLLAPERLRNAVRSRPPILLVHGDEDDVVPLQALPETADALVDAGFEVYTHISKGTGHGIAPDGLGAALNFIKDHLPQA